jgi:hypothetical protein
MPASSRITAKFDSDTKDLSRGVSTVIGRLNKLTTAAKKSNSTLARMARLQAFDVYARGAGVVLNATRAITAWGTATRNAIDDSAKAARNLGILYSDFQSLTLAASEAGVGQDQLFSAMARSTRALYDAQNGTKTAADAFEALGLNVAELGEMDSAARFEAIIGALGNVENAAQRTALSMVIFGRSGAQLGALIASGSAGMREAAAAAQELGLNLTQLQSGNVEAMNDAIGRVGMSFTGITNQITANIAPAITGIAKAWEAFARNLGGAEIGEYIADALWDALEYAASWVDTVSGFFEGLVAMAGGEAKAWEAVAQTWMVVWDMAGRIYDLFDSLWSVMMSGLNKILEILLKSLGNWVELLNKIPGINLDSVEAGLRATEQYFADGAESWGTRAAEKFNSATSATRDIDNGNRVSGQAERAVESWRERAAAARRERDKAVAEAAKPEPVAAAANTLGGFDARSAAGVNFMLAQMGGNAGDLEKQQLDTQKQIARNTGRPGVRVVQFSI